MEIVSINLHRARVPRLGGIQMSGLSRGRDYRRISRRENKSEIFKSIYLNQQFYDLDVIHLMLLTGTWRYSSKPFHYK